MIDYEDVALEIFQSFHIGYTPRAVIKLANTIQRVADEARRELIDKLISVGEACNGMVSVPVLKAWKIEFEDIDLEEWKKLEEGDNND